MYEGDIPSCVYTIKIKDWGKNRKIARSRWFQNKKKKRETFLLCLVRWNCALVDRAFFLLPAKIQCRNKESESDSLTRRVFVKRLKNAAERVCFDRFKITNVIRNIHGAGAVSTEVATDILYYDTRWRSRRWGPSGRFCHFRREKKIILCPTDRRQSTR